MDPDLLEEWRTHTGECSIKLMGTLISQDKRRMDKQIIKIEQLTKELEKMANQQDVSNQLVKMEERIKNKEEEIKSQQRALHAPTGLCRHCGETKVKAGRLPGSSHRSSCACCKLLAAALGARLTRAVLQPRTLWWRGIGGRVSAR
ncbi:hypothetical protein NDU88_003883 [Pleurodeles waltl]|uniref:Uncharacterized protein n=1 Tax=Pleurodeles waltl TaxID=8319 RepID=A0AAV7T7X7_PLEWA|nr:hypothetical protein NDU88_003883 [Pleurodeles waltl]